MIEQLSVNVETATLARSSSKAITGKIFIKADSFVFPEIGWNDFVPIILSWWLNEITELCIGNAKRVSCKFMDGPFQFDIEKENSDNWRIRFIVKRANAEECLFTDLVIPELFIEGVLSAGELVVKACQEKGWASTEIKTLYEGYVKLSQYLKKYG